MVFREEPNGNQGLSLPWAMTVKDWDVLKPVCFLQFLSSQGDHCWNQKTFRGDMGLERVSVDTVGTLMHWTSGGEFCGLTLVTLPFLCSRGQPCPILWGCHLLKCVNNKGHRHNPRHWPVPCRQLQPSFSAVSDSYVAAQLLHRRGEGFAKDHPQMTLSGGDRKPAPNADAKMIPG